MIKFWFKFGVVLLLCAAALAQDSGDDYEDTLYKLYDDWDKEVHGNEDKSIQNNEADDLDTSSFDDYQIEDNRSIEDDSEVPAVEVEQPKNIVKDAKELLSKVDSKMEISNEKTDAKDETDKWINIPHDNDSSDDTMDTKLQELFDSMMKIKNDNEGIRDEILDSKEYFDYEDDDDSPFDEALLDASQNEDAMEDDSDDELTVEENNKEEKIIPYGEDGLKDKEVTSDKSIVTGVTDAVTEASTKAVKVEVKPEPIKQYNDNEVKDLMSVFVEKNTDYLNVSSRKFNLNVDVKYITINYIENLAIVSPRYPDNYLAENNIFDYILQGDGMGIELNVTEVSINGAANDFLLIKPGGLDASGDDGIVFSYNINNERRFRFQEVDRLFVRFQTHATAQPVSGFLGWSFSIRLLGPRPAPPQPVPEPEPTIPTARYTLTKFFGGVTPQDFALIRKDFAAIIAEMATLFVEEVGISPGQMDIAEVTNITRVSVCNLNWPDYDNCAVITFGVPLMYNEDEIEKYGHRLNSADLEDMWDVYSVQEKFARRLRDLGLTDFNKPNDGRALMLWLMTGTACLLIAITLAYALYRWNCFQNYTRMSNFSDTESIISEKKGAGLYPTPYQDLPALYAQPYNQITTADDPGAVDMGFNSKNFARYDLFDNDFHQVPHKMSTRSDNSNAGGAITPRNIYEEIDRTSLYSK